MKSPFSLWLGCVLLVLPASLFAQAPAPDKEEPLVLPNQGTEIFRDQLAGAGFAPLEHLGQLRERGTSVVIVVGNLWWFDQNARKIEAFVSQGGTLMIASDDPAMLGQRVWNNLGLNPSPGFVNAPKDSCWKGTKQFPWAIPKRGIFDERPANAIFQGQTDQSVATNQPRSLTQAVDGDGQWPGIVWTPLAGFPEGSWYDGDRGVRIDGVFVRNGPKPDKDMLAWTGTYGRGRIVVFGDTGPFLNDVVSQPPEENLNFEFLEHLSKWLADADGRKRTTALFVENGTIRSEFALPRADRPGPAFDELANIVLNGANGMLDELQKSGKMNSFKNPKLGDEFKSTLLIWFGALLSVFGLVRVMAKRAGGDPARQFLAGLPRVQMWGRTGRSRVSSMIEQGQLYEAARFRVRSRMEAVFPASMLEARPQIVIDDRVNDPETLETRIQNIWNIGYGKTPLIVNPDGWRIFNEDLVDTIDAFHERDWTFEPRRTT